MSRRSSADQVTIPAMSLSALLSIFAMAGVGALLALPRLYTEDAHVPRATRSAILMLVAAVFGACCVTGVGAVLQIARIGLAGTPPPNTLGTVGRLVGVALAIALWPVCR